MSKAQDIVDYLFREGFVLTEHQGKRIAEILSPVSKKDPTAFKRFQGWWMRTYEQELKERYKWAGAKDTKAAKWLINLNNPAEVDRRALIYFRAEDPFYAKQRYGLAYFAENWNVFSKPIQEKLAEKKVGTPIIPLPR